MSNYRDALESYLKRLDIKADSVYDVGGKELPINDRVKSWDVKECDILDLPEFDLNKPFILNEQSRQVVFCLEVMEYINNPVTAMINLGRLLVDGGTLYITFPFIYPTHNPVSNDYARYTYMGAIKLLTENGFEIEEVVPRYMKSESYGLWQQFLQLEGMHAAKGISHNELGWIIKAKKI